MWSARLSETACSRFAPPLVLLGGANAFRDPDSVAMTGPGSLFSQTEWRPDALVMRRFGVSPGSGHSMRQSIPAWAGSQRPATPPPAPSADRDFPPATAEGLSPSPSRPALRPLQRSVRY